MRIIATAFVLALAVCPAVAGPALDYKYLTIAYMHTEFDSYPDDGMGLSTDVSLQLTGRFHLFFYGALLESDVEGSEANSDLAIIGPGVNVFLSKSELVSAYARIGYGWKKTEFTCDSCANEESLPSTDNEGYFTKAGIRALLSDDLEAAAGISWGRIDDEGITTFEAALYYNLNGNFGLGGGIHATEDSVSLSAGLRFYFQ